MTKRLPKSSKSVAVLPADYAPLLAEIKARIRTAQVKAALAANAELVLLYWQMGQRIAEMQAKEGWGAGVIPRLAADLHAEFPEMRGFSERNLKRMIAFYREYPDVFAIVPAASAQLPAARIFGIAKQDGRQSTAARSVQCSRNLPSSRGREHRFVREHAGPCSCGRDRIPQRGESQTSRRRDHMLAVKTALRTVAGQQGFSPRNLKYMRAFAEAWPETAIVQQPDTQLTKPKESNRVIMHQPGAQLQWLPQPRLSRQTRRPADWLRVSRKPIYACSGIQFAPF
jgi:hypothetical protein